MSNPSRRDKFPLRGSVDQIRIRNRGNASHDPRDPCLMKAKADKNIAQKAPFDPVIRLAHIGFDRHAASNFSLRVLEIMQYLMSY